MRRAITTAAVACALFASLASATASTARAWELSPPPTEEWTLTSIRALYSHTLGQRRGTIGADVVGVPYQEGSFQLEFEIESYDARIPGRQSYPDLFGVALGLRFATRMGGVVSSQWDAAPGVATREEPGGWAYPFTWTLSAGTLAQIVREQDFLLAVHVSFDFHVSRPTWASDVAFVIYPGLRMIWQPSPLRLQIGYDYMPFWIGQGRVEHRASVAAAVQLGSIGLGVRGFGALGQERTEQGGLDDYTFGGALELVL